MTVVLRSLSTLSLLTLVGFVGSSFAAENIDVMTLNANSYFLLSAANRPCPDEINFELSQESGALSMADLATFETQSQGWSGWSDGFLQKRQKTFFNEESGALVRYEQHRWYLQDLKLSLGLSPITVTSVKVMDPALEEAAIVIRKSTSGYVDWGMHLRG